MHFRSLLTVKWNSLLNALRTSAPETPMLSDATLQAAMLGQGAHVAGQMALANGAILTGMLWGGFAAFLIDRNFIASAGTAAVAAALAGFGIIHAETLRWFDLASPFVHAYAGLALLVWVLGRTTPEQAAEDELP